MDPISATDIAAAADQFFGEISKLVSWILRVKSKLAHLPDDVSALHNQMLLIEKMSKGIKEKPVFKSDDMISCLAQCSAVVKTVENILEPLSHVDSSSTVARVRAAVKAVHDQGALDGLWKDLEACKMNLLIGMVSCIAISGP